MFPTKNEYFHHWWISLCVSGNNLILFLLGIRLKNWAINQRVLLCLWLYATVLTLLCTSIPVLSLKVLNWFLNNIWYFQIKHKITKPACLSAFSWISPSRNLILSFYFFNSMGGTNCSAEIKNEFCFVTKLNPCFRDSKKVRGRVRIWIS